MAAFEKTLSGIPAMDEAFDYIRLGDNVVWQVSSLSEFESFVDPFVRQAKADKRNLIYIRFASHPPFVEEGAGVKVYRVELSHRFETFTARIHNIIRDEGIDAFYVFDCLSELQRAWATDLMMGNFFKVTCPFLFSLDTVAFFPILRGRHSNQAIAKIRETTQLLVDVCSEGGDIYLHPLKVWNRYTPTMFMPYRYRPGEGTFKALTDGIDISRYYGLMNRGREGEAADETDSWDRFFMRAKREAEEGELSEESKNFMCRVMMTRDWKLRSLVDKYFTAADYFQVRDRMVGTGMIGGKACGMLLARKIVEKEIPRAKAYAEPHDSFFIGSDVFYTFLVENGCWELRLAQRTPDGYFSVADKFRKAIKEGHFPADIRERFRALLDYFGRSPIIVRSSSILEDGFGNAFAGKYDSVFCVNGGTPEERLSKFEDAVKCVYASTMDSSVLEYRKQRNLDTRDEQMALLVQRVSGSYCGKYFFPCGAGVGFSYSAYRFMRGMDPSAGMLRMVAGLGTRAVDRTQRDYPRLLALDRPTAHVWPEVSQRHRYSQRRIDVLDTEENRLKDASLDELLPIMGEREKKSLLEHDTEAEMTLRQRGDHRQIFYISCQGLAGNETFTSLMRKIMGKLEEVYETPVDIEFCVNPGDGGDFVVNLLQCRPLQVCTDSERVEIPKVNEEEVIIHIRECCMGHSRTEDVGAVIKVDAFSYYGYPYAQKPIVARALGRLNAYFKEIGISPVLIVPGRIGTSSPELGVPVSFADISGVGAIFEVAYSEVGYMPELSFGSHMFQDLVEADILYGAVMEDRTRLLYKPERLRGHENCFLKICPEYPELCGIIHVSIHRDRPLRLFYDMEQEEALLTLRKVRQLRKNSK